MDPRVTELHCIMPVANVLSVLQHGLLSNERAGKLTHHSVAMQAVQDLRDVKVVPGGLRLHQYANLYFHARNPMLSVRRAHDVCVLQFDTQVLSLAGTVITDQNAASKYVRFLAPHQWRMLDFDDIYARSWKHPDDQIREWRHTSRKCAEVLVPHHVSPNLITGALAPDQSVAQRMAQLGFARPISIDPDFFFR